MDVASELNDYLEELDEVSFDGGKTRLNFVEAALLIQGSTYIYSKKVELLHSLVYKTLDSIKDRNQRRDKEKASQEGDGGGAEDGWNDDDEEFGPVDLEMSETTKKSDSTMTTSVAPLPPDCLIPPEIHEKQKLPLINEKGEVICSQKDFRINLFFPGEEDLILLRPTAAARSRLLLDQQPADSEVQQDQQQPENFLPADDHMDPEPDPEEHVERHQASSDGRMIRDRRHAEAGPPRQEEAELPSPWTQLNPYHAAAGDRPFKRGKCYRVPDGLDDGGKRKRKQAAPLQDFGSWFSEAYDSPGQRLKFGPTFTELNYIYLENLKDIMTKRRRIYRQTGQKVSEEELLSSLVCLQEAGPEQEEELMNGGRNDVDGGDEDSDNEDFPDDVPAEFGGGGDFLSADQQLDGMTYEDLVMQRVDQLVVNSRGYTKETDLSRRVKEWEDRIRPKLLLQEQRPALDIHAYEQRVVEALSSVGRSRTLASLVHGLEPHEACSMLLAALHLANDYTVAIGGVSGLQDSLDTMSLTLLSTHRATDRFKAMQPPPEGPPST